MIPVYNGEKTLPELLGRIQKIFSGPIIIVDDGSSDMTAAIAANQPVTLVRHEKNFGKGAALQTGFRMAIKISGKAVITIDADLQHPPEAIPELITLHLKHPDALIIASRKRDKSMPFHRRLSNSITSRLISHRIGQKVTDSQCGFRLIPLKYYQEGQWRFGFHFESELLLRLGMKGVQVLKTDIPTIYPEENTSNIRHFQDTLDFIKLYFETFTWEKKN